MWQNILFLAAGFFAGLSVSHLYWFYKFENASKVVTETILKYRELQTESLKRQARLDQIEKEVIRMQDVYKAKLN